MLTFNLKKEWYDKIASGEKRIEYRTLKDFWITRIENALGKKYMELAVLDKIENLNIPCVFVLGYTKTRLSAVITKIEIVNGKDTDLHIDKPVYAIHLAEVKEVENDQRTQTCN